jgi:hypothetical protein
MSLWIPPTLGEGAHDEAAKENFQHRQLLKILFLGRHICSNDAGSRRNLFPAKLVGKWSKFYDGNKTRDDYYFNLKAASVSDCGCKSSLVKHFA